MSSSFLRLAPVSSMAVPSCFCGRDSGCHGTEFDRTGRSDHQECDHDESLSWHHPAWQRWLHSGKIAGAGATVNAPAGAR
jgi:hypothetical protein